MNLAHYLSSPHWRAVHERKYQKTKRYQCYCCPQRVRLQLHHVTYERLGEERMSDLQFVCGPCHEAIHGHKTLLKKRFPWRRLRAATEAVRRENLKS